MRPTIHLRVTMRAARQALHFSITSIGMALWVVAMAIMGVCCWLSRAAHKVMPDSEIQNCWLAVLWRWHKYGGYLAVRYADGTRLWRLFSVPSALWVQDLPRRCVKLEYYAPLDRKYSDCCPWYVGYFRGKIRLADSEHRADIERYKSDQKDARIARCEAEND